MWEKERGQRVSPQIAADFRAQQNVGEDRRVGDPFWDDFVSILAHSDVVAWIQSGSVRIQTGPRNPCVRSMFERLACCLGPSC